MTIRAQRWKASTTHNPLWVALHIVLGYSEREIMRLTGMRAKHMEQFRTQRTKLPHNIQYRVRTLISLNARELHNIRLASMSDHTEYLAYVEFLRHTAKWLLKLTRKDNFGDYEVEAYQPPVLPSRFRPRKNWRHIPGRSTRILVVDFYVKAPTKEFRRRKSPRRLADERRAASAAVRSQED
jgi:hypothetical protein